MKIINEKKSQIKKNLEGAGKRGQAPFLMSCPQVENVLFLTKKGPVPILPFYYSGFVLY
jgi:hypothetical protein